MWGKVYGSVAMSPKFRRASKEARSLWLLAFAWCIAQQTSGHVPADMLPLLDGTAEDAESLVTAGLWMPDGDGWVFHDWDDYQVDLPAHQDLSTAGSLGMHRRWHLKRGVKSDKCKHCITSDNQVNSRVTEKVNNRKEKIRKDIDIPKGISTSPDATHRGDVTYPQEFETFWKTYPRRSGKGDAFKAWQRATKKIGIEPVLRAAEMYAADPNQPDDRSKIPHPATWLNQERWEDDPLPARFPNQRASDGMMRNPQDMLAWANQMEQQTYMELEQ